MYINLKTFRGPRGITKRYPHSYVPICAVPMYRSQPYDREFQRQRFESLQRPVRFENKNVFYASTKPYSLILRWRSSFKFRSGRIGSWFVKRQETVF
jgi:hypothetical protein